MPQHPVITVFTPTYNRAHLLPRCYESLCRQTSSDFEWVIVDDGSTDDTLAVVRSFMAEIIETTDTISGKAIGHSFLITYQRQPNGGKHRAINRGVRLAQGTLFLILDSDDYLTDDAIQQVIEHYRPVASNPRCGGIGALKALHNGDTIRPGSLAGEEDISCLQLNYGKGQFGDKCEIHLTTVKKEFPFPEIDGEKFCPEALVENRVSTRYFLRYFNHVICRCEYLEDGLTHRIVQIRMESPIASMMTYAELTRYPIPLKQRIKAAINYYRFALCQGKNRQVTGTDQGHDVEIPTISLCWIWTQPLGWMMHLRDKINTRSNRRSSAINPTPEPMKQV